MLFLFNDVVFDIDDPQTSAQNARQDLDAADMRAMSQGKAIRLLREAIFEDQHIARTAPDKAFFLACLIAWKTEEANALLAVKPEAIDDPKKVQLRFASVSLVTMVQLRELQAMGRLSSHAANMTVWSHAPQRMRA